MTTYTLSFDHGVISTICLIKCGLPYNQYQIKMARTFANLAVFVMLMCGTALAGSVRIHNHCGRDVTLDRSAAIVMSRHMHFMCSVDEPVLLRANETATVDMSGVWPFISAANTVDAVYSGDGYLVNELSYSDIKMWMTSERTEIAGSDRVAGATGNCSLDDVDTFFFDISTDAGTVFDDVYLCAINE